MLGFFVVSLDAQVVNVALPNIRCDLGGGLTGLQWVVTGYTLSFSALLLFAGTFSDRVGARSAYRTGMVVFVLASAACGLAPSLALLVGARIVQGLGAALVTPTSLALIREAYDDPRRRSKAIAYWAMGGSVALAAGPVLGGALAQFDWRFIFFLNLPVGVAAIFVLSRVAPSPRRVAHFDWTGQVCAVLALASLTYAIIAGGELGYGSTAVVAAFVISATAFACFLVAEARGRNPMVPLNMFRSRTVSIALLTAFINMVGFYGVVFVQSLYFQQLRGASPLQTGLLFLPMSALVALLNPVVARTVVRFGRIVPILGGQLCMAAGLVLLCTVPGDTPTILVAVLMIPVGVGGSFTVPPVTSLLIDSVLISRAGTASGVLNTFRQMGGALGVAVYGAVIAGQASFLPGLRACLLGTAVLLVVTAAATVTLRRATN
ncbi:DHA2 family methylenomycin A resistance protein-like MFS transporter [Antricoccus suffuscus]|uniref:DHA2 family methylenomycin A resistance protein-like MFS transporter n=1 Tax=Antricoccus suffuscus TaxID=1629062 RepID=A0A2T0ZRS7_9ACTN|nr:MFS transporter [Antricoccus suffuscus]PRZ39066.1 DHA2 family methylenomycin A resistance protein-like MFS transporter [Antricoccus suffuscus]